MTTTTENQTTQAQWDAANRFLDQLFIDPMLANNYQQISQQANGQDNAPEILTSWLEEQGYDTTPELVYAALINLQNTSLAYWTGIYGQSFLENSQPAPVLAIAPNTEGNTIAYLDGVELKNFVFESVETEDTFHPTLSWDLENNSTVGNITFYYTSEVTLDSEPPTGYTGNWFEGTLQTSVSSVSQKYYGAIGEPTDSSAIPQLILADGEGESFWDKYSTYVYIGIGVFGFISAIVIIGTLVYRKRNVPERNFDEVRQAQERRTAAEWTKKLQERYPNDFVDKQSFPSRSAQKIIETYGDEQIGQSQFLNAVRSEIDNIMLLQQRRYHSDGDELTAKQWNDGYNQYGNTIWTSAQMEEYYKSTQAKARQAIVAEFGDQKMTMDAFDKAVELKIQQMQELGFNEELNDNFKDIWEQQGDLFSKLLNGTITPDEMSDLKLLSKVGDRREAIEPKDQSSQQNKRTLLEEEIKKQKLDDWYADKIEMRVPFSSFSDIAPAELPFSIKYHDDISRFSPEEFQNFVAKIRLAKELKNDAPNPPAEFQVLKKEPIFQKEITKHIKEQKSLFSKLEKVEPTVMESLKTVYSKETIDISLAIENIYKNPSIIDQWEPLIKEGKDNHYFDKSLEKKWQEQPEALKKYSQGAEGSWINEIWCSQDLIKWRDNRDEWLDKVGKMLSDANSVEVEQRKSTEFKAPDKPHATTGTQPVDQRRSPATNFTQQKVPVINFNDDDMEGLKEIRSQDLSDPDQELSKRPDPTKDPRNQELKKSRENRQFKPSKFEK